jgi:hypothetical protein
VCFARNEERDRSAQSPPAESSATSMEPSKRNSSIPHRDGSPGPRRR